MFKDGVSLKKNAWYVKLLHFMWGASYEDFPNLCPLFWAIIGSLLVLPFWLIWRVVCFIFSIGGRLTWKQVRNPLKYLAVGFWFWLTFNFLAVLLSFCIIDVISTTINGASWKEWIDFLWHTGIAVLAVIAGAALVIGVFAYSEYVKSIKRSNVHHNSKAARKLTSPLIVLPYNVASWLCWPLKALWSLLRIIGGFLYYDIYKKNCPFINWEEP